MSCVFKAPNSLYYTCGLILLLFSILYARAHTHTYVYILKKEWMSNKIRGKKTVYFVCYLVLPYFDVSV